MRAVRGVVLVAALAAATLSGCAVTRSEVKLGGTPGGSGAAVVPAARTDAARKPIVIGNIVDARRFESAPRDPSVPSLGTEGGGDEVKARAIGRKRNTYGMALGDVLLEPGTTVASVVRRELAAALGDAGYQVVDSGAPAVDVRILQFWSWLTPGFWAVTVSTIIATDLVLPGRDPIPVVVRTSEPALAVTDGVWTEAIDKALVRWRGELLTRAAPQP